MSFPFFPCSSRLSHWLDLLLVLLHLMVSQFLSPSASALTRPSSTVRCARARSGTPSRRHFCLIFLFFPCLQYLVAQFISSYRKIQRGMIAYERNTGEPHPLSNGIETSESSFGKRDTRTGSIMLTNLNDSLWYGTISVGTPPKNFTGVYRPCLLFLSLFKIEAV